MLRYKFGSVYVRTRSHFGSGRLGYFNLYAFIHACYRNIYQKSLCDKEREKKSFYYHDTFIANILQKSKFMQSSACFNCDCSFVFSSSEPLGSLGKLIVYIQSLASVNYLQRSYSLKLLDQSKPSFMWRILGVELKFV